MPHITVRGIEKKELTVMAPEIKEIVVKASGVNPDYVKIFHSPVTRVDAPEEVAADVYWMHRPQEMCDAVAEGLTTYLKNRGYGFIQITFTEFPGNLFFEDNIHY